jgi:hypothetical protein
MDHTGGEWAGRTMVRREIGPVIGIWVSLLLVAVFFLALCTGANASAFQGYSDALLPTVLPAGLSRTFSEAPAPSTSLSPNYQKTSEYLIGSVAVGVVLLESNGTIDASTENWTSSRESQVISKIQAGLSWLAGCNPDAHVSFVYDIHLRVQTSYEPINLSHSAFDRDLWITEAMTNLGYPGTCYSTGVWDYVNALRKSFNTDWAFAIFVVDSLNDPDGCFTDSIDSTRKYSAFTPRLGGPFCIMTYDNGNFGIGSMDLATVHETCHIFHATDEYDGLTEKGGYLGVYDNEGAACIMAYPLWQLCSNSRQQLGWRDSDGDGLQDIVDPFPGSALPWIINATIVATAATPAMILIKRRETSLVRGLNSLRRVAAILEQLLGDRLSDFESKMVNGPGQTNIETNAPASTWDN